MRGGSSKELQRAYVANIYLEVDDRLVLYFHNISRVGYRMLIIASGYPFSIFALTR